MQHRNELLFHIGHHALNNHTFIFLFERLENIQNSWTHWVCCHIPLLLPAPRSCGQSCFLHDLFKTGNKDKLIMLALTNSFNTFDYLHPRMSKPLISRHPDLKYLPALFTCSGSLQRLFCVFTVNKNGMARLSYHQRKTAGIEKVNICLNTLNNAHSQSTCRITSSNLCEKNQDFFCWMPFGTRETH